VPARGLELVPVQVRELVPARVLALVRVRELVPARVRALVRVLELGLGLHKLKSR
jgi:hypothetical protein